MCMYHSCVEAHMQSCRSHTSRNMPVMSGAGDAFHRWQIRRSSLQLWSVSRRCGTHCRRKQQQHSWDQQILGDRRARQACSTHKTSSGPPLPQQLPVAPAVLWSRRLRSPHCRGGRLVTWRKRTSFWARCDWISGIYFLVYPRPH